MKTLGHRSLAAFLRMALRIALYVLYGLAVLFGLGSLSLILYSHGVELFPWIEAPPPPPPAIAWLVTLVLAVTMAATILIVGRLRRIFVTLAEGDPFVPENAIHLRVIWITLAIWELSRYVLGGVTFAVMYVLQIEPREGIDRSPIDVSLSVWFAVLTLIVLAEVFREGARLRQEQQLTI